jgi:hypothetical protein
MKESDLFERLFTHGLPIHIHLHGDTEAHTALMAILRRIEKQGAHLMADVNTMKAALASIDTATNNIAADIDRIKGQIGTGMSQADVDAVQAVLDSTVTKLEAIAAATPDA